MQRYILICGLIVSAALIVVGCERSANVNNPSGAVAIQSEGADGLLLAEEPEGAKGVLDVRKDAKDGDEVLVVGRVGGRAEPLVKGRASFTIVDPSLKTCSDIPGDNCERPWDYCCENPSDLARATVLVKFVDEGGKTVARDARELLGVEPLQTVVVRGKAKRDADGNLTVLASALHVRGKKP
jgi:hypothetical protein